jgi:hypothetical protein
MIASVLVWVNAFLVWSIQCNIYFNFSRNIDMKWITSASSKRFIILIWFPFLNTSPLNTSTQNKLHNNHCNVVTAFRKRNFTLNNISKLFKSSNANYIAIVSRNLYLRENNSVKCKKLWNTKSQCVKNFPIFMEPKGVLFVKSSSTGACP